MDSIYTTWGNNGHVWHKKGNSIWYWHRLDGPAHIIDRCEYYWIDNNKYSNFISYIKTVIEYKCKQKDK